MRPITFEERQDLVLRANGQDLVDFIHELDYLGRKYRSLHRRLLALLDRAPRPTNLPSELLQFVRNGLAEQGRELTPDETKEEVERTLAKIRNFLRDTGQEVPDSDTSLLTLLS